MSGEQAQMGITMATRFHLRLDIQGALQNWRDSTWRNCARDSNGKMLTPSEVKASLLDDLAAGKKYLPIGECDGFDFQRGCPGHPIVEKLGVEANGE